MTVLEARCHQLRAQMNCKTIPRAWAQKRMMGSTQRALRGAPMYPRSTGVIHSLGESIHLRSTKGASRHLRSTRGVSVHLRSILEVSMHLRNTLGASTYLRSTQEASMYLRSTQRAAMNLRSTQEAAMHLRSTQRAAMHLRSIRGHPWSILSVHRNWVSADGQSTVWTLL